MNAKKRMKNIFIFGILLLLIVPAVSSTETITQNITDNDIEFNIRGGFGTHISIINHGDDTKTVFLNITLKRIFSGKIDLLKEYVFQVLPYSKRSNWEFGSFFPRTIEVTLSTDNETLTRKGIVVMCFVVFLN